MKARRGRIQGQKWSGTDARVWDCILQILTVSRATLSPPLNCMATRRCLNCAEPNPYKEDFAVILSL